MLLALAALLAGTVFAGGRQPRHYARDMYIGFDLGFALSPNISKLNNENAIPAGDYALVFDAGLNFDYYLFSWLSLNTGFFAHAGIYLLWDKPVYLIDDTNFSDYAKTPICITIPIMAHINIPGPDFLYLGLGVNFNFPVKSMLDKDLPGIDTKGRFFVGLPIDFGFDFIKPGKGGGRFIFRLTPEFHTVKMGGRSYSGKPITLGFIWQIYNINISSNRPQGYITE